MQDAHTAVLSVAEILRRLPVPLRRRGGAWLCRTAMRVTALDRVNALYARCRGERGWRFAAAVLADLGVSIAVEATPAARTFLDSVKERKGPSAVGGFITVSNHPLGALDGIALMAVVGEVRPDFRIFANPILMRIAALRPCLFPIDPIAHAQAGTANRSALMAAIRHLRTGHPLGLFPAGSVATLRVGGGVRDAPWRTAAGKLVLQSRCPVLPIHFEGRNSLLFYLLGLVDWRLRSLLLPREVFRFAGGTIRLALRDPIDADRLAHMATAATVIAALQDATT